MASKFYEYDVFISYAVEDRIAVNELVEKLKDAGVTVWYAGQQLTAGRDVEETIKEGLVKSRHGIVLLSHNYFAKNWPQRELHALWGRENDQERRLFPVWHKISEEEIKLYDPFVARTWGIPTDEGMDLVVRKLLRAMREESAEPINVPVTAPRQAKASISKVLFASPLLMLILALVYYFFIRDVPPSDLIRANIEERISNLQEEILNDHLAEINTRDGKAVTIEEIKAWYERYNGLKSQYRNEYYLNTGYSKLSHKKNVQAALDMDLEALGPYNYYGFVNPNIYAIDEKPSPHTLDVKYIFINTQPVQFEIRNEEKPDDVNYVVTVSYSNPIRYLSVDLVYSKRSDWMKKRTTTFCGFLPEETYRFSKTGDSWSFVGLEQ